MRESADVDAIGGGGDTTISKVMSKGTGRTKSMESVGDIEEIAEFLADAPAAGAYADAAMNAEVST